MNRESLIMFFVKNPEPGRVKTRLAEEIGEEKAAGIYRVMAEDALAALDAARIQVEIHYAPEDAGPAVARWLGPGRRYVSQAGADLGERMENAFVSAFESGAMRAILVGSDIPELTPSHAVEALEALTDNDAALAPSGDGGYTLIGFRAGRFEPLVFRGMNWGGREVLEETLSILRDGDLNVKLMPELRDIDDLSDLRLLFERGQGRPGKTMSWLVAHSEKLLGGLKSSGPSCRPRKRT